MFSMLQSSDSYKQAIKEDILDLYDNLNSDQIDQYLKKIKATTLKSTCLGGGIVK